MQYWTPSASRAAKHALVGGFPSLASCARTLAVCPFAGIRRVRVKVALNVAINDLLMVLNEDEDLPWLQQAINRATLNTNIGAAE